ncbi:DUF1642 domain-containing protein [Lacticaseibacillus rhamnosus]|uniref:DUF1642 domain-containing protein n=1 Tax=Lacticaseibacillus rhamnosus TaxID=47715 RepID=UPI00280B6BB0|nr:DUF1642 domain-containing protein [Lacticaseibacillus rhamnosus]
MSEEKLYAVKNRSGEFWDFSDSSGFWSLAISDFPTTPNKKQAELAAKDHGGHVVTFVEEPKKVVLTKEQAKIVEKARVSDIPATYISACTDEYNGKESLLMNAYVNGYTVAKEKKYNVKVPHTDDSYFYKVDDEYCNAGDSYYLEGMTDKKWFTDAEIEHYGLGDCEKVWCDSDDE